MGTYPVHNFHTFIYVRYLPRVGACPGHYCSSIIDDKFVMGRV